MSKPTRSNRAATSRVESVAEVARRIEARERQRAAREAGHLIGEATDPNQLVFASFDGPDARHVPAARSAVRGVYSGEFPRDGKTL